jgi:hypothetical protein
MTRRWTIPLASLIALALAGCTAAGPTPGQLPARTMPAAVVTLPTPVESPPPAEPTLSQSAIDELGAVPAVNAARDKYAASLGIPADQVNVVSVEPVTWNDSSLGCGKPGEMYLQVLTPGYKVTLEANGQQAVYHTDKGTGHPPSVVRCDQESSISAFQPLPQVDLNKMGAGVLDKVRRDLEGRIGAGTPIALDQTTVAEVTELICDGTPTPTSGGPGKVILEFHLRAGKDVHVYRAWGSDILYCGLADKPITE